MEPPTIDPSLDERRSDAAEHRGRPGVPLRRQILVLIVGVIAVSGVVLLWILASLRAQAIASGERLTESFAHVIAEQTTRTLQTVDERLQIASDRIGRLRTLEKFDAGAGRALLLEEISELPFVRAFSVCDAQGRVISSSDPAASM